MNWHFIYASVRSGSNVWFITVMTWFMYISKCRSAEQRLSIPCVKICVCAWAGVPLTWLQSIKLTGTFHSTDTTEVCKGSSGLIYKHNLNRTLAFHHEQWQHSNWKWCNNGKSTENRQASHSRLSNSAYSSSNLHRRCICIINGRF